MASLHRLILLSFFIATVTFAAGQESSSRVPGPNNSTPVPKMKVWQDPKNSLDESRLAATAGKSAAQYQLGIAYLFGKDLTQDLKLAVFWLKKSADLGDIRAEYTLGVLYSEGYGVVVNQAAARKWLRLAASWNLLEAQQALEQLDKKFAAREIDQQLEHARKGDAAAQYALGKAHRDGVPSLDKNPIKAREWFAKAAVQNHHEAEYELALLLKSGEGGAIETAQARLLLQRAAEGGLQKARVILGDLTREQAVAGATHTQASESVRKATPKIPQLAAAQRGDVAAQFDLGKRLLHGDGLERNPTEAIRWLRKAAEAQHPTAQVYLGEIFALGVDVEQNYTEAARWYLRAAQSGDAEAQYRMGSFYSVGLGVRASAKESRRWYSAAAKQGNVKARERLAGGAAVR